MSQQPALESEVASNILGYKYIGDISRNRINSLCSALICSTASPFDPNITSKTLENWDKFNRGSPGWSGLDHESKTEQLLGHTNREVTEKESQSSHWSVVGWETTRVSQNKRGLHWIYGEFFFSLWGQAGRQLPREAVAAPPVEVVKTWLDQALSSLAWPHSWPCLHKRHPMVASNLN